MSNILSLRGVSKYFDDTVALNNISLDLHEGEIFTLIGPNSAGKSTLVKSIVGLLQPDHGVIEVCGNSVVENPLATKSCIGYIPDEPSVWQTMTGEEFLYFTQALFKVPEHTRGKNIAKLLEIFALSGIEKKSFEEYSRGNKQKFSILSAIAHKPKILVVDEPIVGLDPLSAETVKTIFKDHTKEGGTVLLVTHTLPVAEEISDRIGFLKNGELVALGTIASLREQAHLPQNAPLIDVYTALAS